MTARPPPLLLFRLISFGFAVLVVLGATGCDPCQHQPGTLCRIAGTGESAFNGDGKTALDTAFYQVSQARFGPDGLLYAMDFNNHRLRRVTAKGTVETVVGTGDHNFATDGAGELETALENPVDFAFSPDGVLHLVMLHDPRVLQVRDGVVHVIAGVADPGDSGDGGPARLAAFTQLTGIAFAADGTIYVADELANRVRAIRPDGVVIPIAGTGAEGFGGDGGKATSAQLHGPRNLAVGPDGSLYIADAGNHVIRRVRPDGLIETIAGTGEEGFSGDGGPASAAKLNRPRGVAISADGTLYIADTGNERIRRVAADGTIATIAGTGERGTDGNGGEATKAQVSAPSSASLSADETKLLIGELGSGTVSELQLK